jgi:hypothetical protein
MFRNYKVIDILCNLCGYMILVNILRNTVGYLPTRVINFLAKFIALLKVILHLLSSLHAMITLGSLKVYLVVPTALVFF